MCQCQLSKSNLMNVQLSSSVGAWYGCMVWYLLELCSLPVAPDQRVALETWLFYLQAKKKLSQAIDFCSVLGWGDISPPFWTKLTCDSFCSNIKVQNTAYKPILRVCITLIIKMKSNDFNVAQKNQVYISKKVLQYSK